MNLKICVFLKKIVHMLIHATETQTNKYVNKFLQLNRRANQENK